MKGVSVFILIGLCAGWGSTQFLNHRPFPTYSLENMPDTQFSCRDKILGGYYADSDTMCQMFHICVKVAGVGVQDFRFLCPNGTAFDQDHQICADWEDVDCDAATLYYSSDNFDLYRIGSGFESKAVKYGEDEETFSLQRAETGDARLNREHQSQRVNQQKEQPQFRKNKAQVPSQSANNDRDIFKGSSSSNFFNNKHNGKETDEDYDDSGNVNQDRDPVQKKKLIRKQNVRPAQNDEQSGNQEIKKTTVQQNDDQFNNQQRRRPVQTRRPSAQDDQSNVQQNRRPVQKDDQYNNQPSRRPVQNDDQYSNQQQSRRPVQNGDQQNRRPVQNDDQYTNQQQSRRPVQNGDQQNRRPVQNDDQYNNQQQNRRPVHQQNRRPVQSDNQDYQQQNRKPVQNSEQQTRSPVVESQNNKENRQENYEAQTYRPPRPTGFVNNFAGSSYIPTTTAKPSSTTLNADQYSSAVANHRQRNGQRHLYNGDGVEQNQNSPTPSYTISTPAPFKQTQQYNSPPVRKTTKHYYDDGQYRPSTEPPSDEPENYPSNFPKQPITTQQKPKQTQSYPTQAPVTRNTQYNNQFEATKVKQADNYQTQSPVSRNTQYNSQFDIQKTKVTKQFENQPTQAPVSRNTQYNNQYEATKVKQSDNFSTQPPRNTQYNTQYDVPKTKATKPVENYSTQPPRSTQYNTQYDVTKTKATKQAENFSTQPPRNTQYNTQYDVPKVKVTQQSENFPTQAPVNKISQFNNQFDVPKVKTNKPDNYPSTPFKNDYSSTAFNKKPTTPVKQTDNFPTTLAPRSSRPGNQASTQFHSNQRSTDNFPSTFAPRTNSGYTQINQQTTQYKQSAQSQKPSTQFNNQPNNNQQSSTPRTTPFTQYTPTVPKLSTTTPVSRSNRYDETQYDDGSYDSNGRREDEFLKTAHSQNIASSRNEFAKTSKNPSGQSTQKPQYESPRPFSITPNTPKVTDYQKPTEKNVEHKNVPVTNKKVKDASYDYAYYDTNVGSEPEYDIETDIKKATVKN